jgi:RecA-family ATPase
MRKLDDRQSLSKSADYSGKFRLFRKDDWAKLPAMRWQIKDLIPLHGVTLLFGQPKVGKKSFVGISLACAVAAGVDWCSHETQKGEVLYVVGEGSYGILRRQAAWEKAHGCSADGLRYFASSG